MDDRNEQTTSELVSQALRFLPVALVASAVGERDVNQVEQWRTGGAEPGEEELKRLKILLEIATFIENAESRQTATSWLTTANALLDGELPIKLIRELESQRVAEAVEAFIHGWAG